jgi:hypothetical protein
MEAIQGIRRSNPGYFDRVDVRIVTGDGQELPVIAKMNKEFYQIYLERMSSLFVRRVLLSYARFNL